MTLFSVALKNLKRSVFRSAAIALSVAVVAATLFSIAAIMGSSGAALQRSASRLGAELIVVPLGEVEAFTEFFAGNSGNFKMDMRYGILEEVRSITGVMRAAPLLFLRPSGNSSFFVVGYDPKTDFTVKPWLKQSRTPADGEIVIGGKIMDEKNGKVMLSGRELTVGGRLETTGLYFLDNSIFLPLSTAWELAGTPGRISAIMVKPEIDDFRHVNSLRLTIQQKIEGVKSLMTEEMISTVRKQLAALMKAIVLTAAVIWIISLIIIGVIFSMIINERQREIGLLRAMGATKMHVFGLTMLEALTLSALGGGIGILTGGILLYSFQGAIRTLLNVQYVLPGPGVLMLIIIACLSLAFISGAGAAFFPALRSSLMQPQEAISKGNRL